MFYNQLLKEQAFQLIREVYSSLRQNVLQSEMYPWQEVSIVLDCFIKLYNDLESMLTMDEENIYSRLIYLYHHSYKKVIDSRIKASNLCTIQSFEEVLLHLRKMKKLKDTIMFISDEIRIRQQKWNNVDYEDLDSFFDHQSKYSPKECLQELSKYNQLSCNEPFFVERNSKGDFFIVNGCISFLDDYCGYLDNYEDSNSFIGGVKKYDNAACIWSFCNGFARIISRDGKWGYISEESKDVMWIGENVLYAEDFSCDRGRIQINDSNKSYKFLGLCLDDCFQKSFRKATNYDNGYATVSDEFCEDYHIDVFGNIVDEDKERYEKAKDMILEDRRKGQEAYYRSIRKRNSYDPETEIMDSLSGNGVDPELFGF